MKKGDRILVLGEANEVFEVEEVTQNGNIILDTGFLEPREKCFRIPDHFKDNIITKTTRTLPMELAMKVFGAD